MTKSQSTSKHRYLNSVELSPYASIKVASKFLGWFSGYSGISAPSRINLIAANARSFLDGFIFGGLTPIQFLQRLNKFRPHNPLVMALVILRRVLISVSHHTPPMRLAGRCWWKRNMKRVHDIVSQAAVLQTGGSIIGITNFFRELRHGNGVFWSAAMSAKQRGIWSHIGNPVSCCSNAFL